MSRFVPKRIRAENIKLPQGWIPRKNLFDSILPWLNRPEVIVLTGARQTGKSTLVFQLIKDRLLQTGRPVFYFNLDLSGQLDWFKSADALINLIHNQEKPPFIIIDEVQRLTNAGLFLKSLTDASLAAKIIVTGSSSLELKTKVHETLTGRKIVFYVYPLSHHDLVSGLKQPSFNQACLEHSLTFGNYPAVATAPTETIKKGVLGEIFTSYLEKDVRSYLKVANESAFNQLITLLSSQVGQLVNKSELSNSLNLHLNTLENYLFYLEQTFVVDYLTPFFKNKRREILKSPKVYFLDLGLRNLAVRNLNRLDFRQDKGQLLENFCFIYLKQTLDPLTPIHFWRTKAGAEVDFVVLKGLQPIPIEVKAQTLIRPQISRSFNSFLSTYKPAQAYLVNLNLNTSKIFKKTRVEFITPEKLVALKSF